jgi:hypothetical protein
MSQEDAKGEMTFGSDVALLFLQKSTKRMMRANERLMRGITDMVNCQMELGRTLLQHHLDVLKSGPHE